MNKIALIYCRESSEDKEVGDSVSTSIDNQKKYGMEEANKDGYSKAISFIDVNVESTNPIRKGFNQMIQFIKENFNNEIKVYIKDYTRLGRGMTFFHLRDKLTSSGIRRQNIFFYLEPHQNKINNPQDNAKDWNKMSQQERNGLINYWKKESINWK